MKAFLKISCCLSLLFATSAFADLGLNGGSALPGATVYVLLDELRTGVQYNVECKLNSDNKSAQSFDKIKLFTTGGYNAAVFSVNGTSVENNGQIDISTNSESTLLVSVVYKDAEAIAIRNLSDDVIRVEGCRAST
jgi:hypothetical protein